MRSSKLRPLVRGLIGSQKISEEDLKCYSYDQVMDSYAYIRPIKPNYVQPYGIERYGMKINLRFKLNRDKSY